MAATCKFCDRIFEKKQGVRAHLRHCTNYLATKDKIGKPQGSPKASLPKPQAMDEPAFSHKKIKLSDGTIIIQGEDGVLYFENERERLLYHRDQEARCTKEAANRKRQKIGAGQRVQEEKNLRERRREIIQDVKSTVIDWSFWPIVPVAARADAKLAIEKTLSTLQVLELPRSELIEIAQGLREKIYSSYLNP